MDALAGQRAGKRTLRTHKVDGALVPKISPEQSIALRQNLNLSRPVFADCLRTKGRTLDNWEQARAKPNAQAIVLIHLVAKYPDTVKRLATLYFCGLDLEHYFEFGVLPPNESLPRTFDSASF